VADQAVLDPKPSVKPKFRRGNLPPSQPPLLTPGPATKRLTVVPTTPDFGIREDAPPRPRFVRGDTSTTERVGKVGDAEPFIRPPSRAQLMAGR
jgi:hypothetical protein